MDDERLEQTRWWRVEINKAGTVTSCEPVENSERDSRTVHYFREVCREHALATATRWLKRRREWSRQYERKRRSGRQQKGICQDCSKKICATSKVYCASHLNKAREYQRTRNQRVADGIEKAPALDPVVALQQDRARHERYRRMTVQLPVILAVFDQLDGRLWSPFRQWLVDEIAQRGGSVQAAE